jgi:hypothetical protein
MQNSGISHFPNKNIYFIGKRKQPPLEEDLFLEGFSESSDDIEEGIQFMPQKQPKKQKQKKKQKSNFMEEEK